MDVERSREEGTKVATLAIFFTTSYPLVFLWLGRGGLFSGVARDGWGGVFGGGSGGGGWAGGVGGELLYCDREQVGGDIGDHHILAARCHLRSPVRVALGGDPLGLTGRGGEGWGGRWEGGRLGSEVGAFLGL